MTKAIFHKVAIVAMTIAIVGLTGVTVTTESSPAYAAAVSSMTVGVQASGSAGIGS